LINRDSTPVCPSAKELPFEVELEYSDENGEEYRPGNQIYVNTMVEEDYEDDTPTFSYNGLRVPINILFDQIEGFTLYPRGGVNLPPITSMEDMSPDI
jgi:hypothetical protein